MCNFGLHGLDQLDDDEQAWAIEHQLAVAEELGAIDFAKQEHPKPGQWQICREYLPTPQIYKNLYKII